jgi:hypothetical protein
MMMKSQPCPNKFNQGVIRDPTLKQLMDNRSCLLRQCNTGFANVG